MCYKLLRVWIRQIVLLVLVTSSATEISCDEAHQQGEDDSCQNGHHNCLNSVLRIYHAGSDLGSISVIVLVLHDVYYLSVLRPGHVKLISVSFLFPNIRVFPRNFARWTGHVLSSGDIRVEVILL